MSLFSSLPKNPYLRADSLAELCALSDVDFVRCAFVTILGRQPDAEGEAYYTARLRAGVDKLTILGQLRFSKEGPLHDPGLAGLDRALKRHRRANMPFIGWFIRTVTGQRGETRIERAIRSVQNDVGVLSSRMTEGFLHLNHVIHEMNIQVLAIRAAGRSAARQDTASLFPAAAPNLDTTPKPVTHPEKAEIVSTDGIGWQASIARALRS